MNKVLSGLLVILCSISPLLAGAPRKDTPTKVTIDDHGVLAINGRKIFPIGFTVPPAPNAKAFNGRPALEEFRDAGAIFIRTGPMLDHGSDRVSRWDEQWIEREQQYMHAAAAAGMYCMPWLKELSHLEAGNTDQEQRLLRVLRLFKDHPAMGVWKGEDEPAWAEENSEGKKDLLPGMKRVYDLIRNEDPNHPVWIVQAPRGTVEQLRRHNPAYDIGGVDVYPISYPPGSHVPADDNKQISMIGDYAQKTAKVMDGKKPFWFTLQIAWSGVVKPGKTLRFPTFEEERFMTYQAIINGARGLVYFGGNLPQTLNPRDRELGWNWTFWQRVLRPIIEEIGDKSPLAEALVQPDSSLSVSASSADIELCVREVGDDIFILACSRQPLQTNEIRFTGLPKSLADGEVLYESPRKVTCEDGAFKDWFAPFDVHVYRFSRK